MTVLFLKHHQPSLASRFAPHTTLMYFRQGPRCGPSTHPGLPNYWCGRTIVNNNAISAKMHNSTGMRHIDGSGASNPKAFRSQASLPAFRRSTQLWQLSTAVRFRRSMARKERYDISLEQPLPWSSDLRSRNNRPH